MEYACVCWNGDNKINGLFPPWLITSELAVKGVVEENETVTLHLFVICYKSVCDVFWYTQFSHSVLLLVMSEISLKDLGLFVFVSLEMWCPWSDSVSEGAQWLSMQNL